MLAYLDHLEARGELDLEVATEFLVLIAALLELKSRLMLPREDGRAARAGAGRGGRGAAARGCSRRAATARAADHLRGAAGRRGGHPLPQRAAAAAAAARRAGDSSRASTRPSGSGPRWAACCCHPPRVDVDRTSARCAFAWRSGWRTCARCCAAARTTFDEAVRGADRVTVAITLFALLELYKQGEATWAQSEPFGEIARRARARAGRVAAARGGGRA